MTLLSPTWLLDLCRELAYRLLITVLSLCLAIVHLINCVVFRGVGHQLGHYTLIAEAGEAAPICLCCATVLFLPLQRYSNADNGG